MTEQKPSQLLYPAAAVALVAFVFLVSTGGPAVMGSPFAIVAGVLVLAALISIWQPAWQLVLTGIVSLGAAYLLYVRLPSIAGRAELGFWCLVVSAWLTGWAFVQSVWGIRRQRPRLTPLLGIVALVAFIGWCVILWELVVRGLASPPELPPAPSELFWGEARAASQP